VELRGFEPLTPSMRTTVSEVSRGHRRQFAGSGGRYRLIHDAAVAAPAAARIGRAGHSPGQLINHLKNGAATPGVYMPAAVLFDLAASHLSDRNYLALSQLALHDLQLLDGEVASIARSLTFGLVFLGTTHLPRQSVGPSARRENSRPDETIRTGQRRSPINLLPADRSRRPLQQDAEQTRRARHETRQLPP
jgi:hypothetical protein